MLKETHTSWNFCLQWGLQVCSSVFYVTFALNRGLKVEPGHAVMWSLILAALEVRLPSESLWSLIYAVAWRGRMFSIEKWFPDEVIVSHKSDYLLCFLIFPNFERWEINTSLLVWFLFTFLIDIVIVEIISLNCFSHVNKGLSVRNEVYILYFKSMEKILNCIVYISGHSGSIIFCHQRLCSEGRKTTKL